MHSKHFIFFSLIWALAFPLEGEAQTFGPLQQISDSSVDPRVVHSSDLDGDGDLDVLFGDYYSVSWHSNNGFGSFGNQVIISNDVIIVTSICTADFDSDGDVDVISASRGTDEISWYSNDGVGVFGPKQIVASNALNVGSISCADLDGDGDIDVLAAYKPEGFIQKIVWYENDGSGVFSSEHSLIGGTSEGHYGEVFARDIDGDGDIDIISDSKNEFNYIRSWVNNDNLTFTGDDWISLSGEFSRNFPSDLDGDGDVDIVSAQHTGGESQLVIYSHEEGEFQPPETIYSFEIDNHLVFAQASFLTSDFDGDGDIDLLCASGKNSIPSGWKVHWQSNNGDGSFGQEEVITTQVNGTALYAADLDSDGDTDVLLSSEDKIYWLENLSPPPIEEEENPTVEDSLDVEDSPLPVSIFPNPLSTSATVGLKDLQGDLVLEIFDVVGRRVRREDLTVETGSINLERRNLQAGQYVLRLSGDESSYELPFVVE